MQGMRKWSLFFMLPIIPLVFFVAPTSIVGTTGDEDSNDSLAANSGLLSVSYLSKREGESIRQIFTPFIPPPYTHLAGFFVNVFALPFVVLCFIFLLLVQFFCIRAPPQINYYLHSLN